MTSYPMLERIRQVSDQSQIISKFLDWLLNEGYVICVDDVERYVPAYQKIEDWLAEYFGIDQKQAEAERRAILAGLQEETDV